MQHRFKKHDKVKLLINPHIDTVEPYTDPEIEIKAGMTGEINLILPNGDYHVKIIQDNKVIAYVMIDEDSLEAL